MTHSPRHPQTTVADNRVDDPRRIRTENKES